MKPIPRIACVLFVLSFAASFSATAPAAAPDHETAPRRSMLATSPSSIRVGRTLTPAKAAADTHCLVGPWGSGADHNGQFQDTSLEPAWNGWTSEDNSIQPDIHWQISSYFAENLNGNGPGNLAAYLGDPDLPACSQWDTIGGYGNGWWQAIRWTGEVANPSAPCDVLLSAALNLDTEPGYDYARVRLILPGVNHFVDLWENFGRLDNYPLDLSFTVQPDQYTGEFGTEVRLEIQFTSDGGFSDADCMWPTHGALQIDDIQVSLLNGATATFDDFQDGTFGNWTPVTEQGVGDFAHLQAWLGDADPCTRNNSPQVCFIDDGLVVPGTGGSMCINWCYGPDGYIVNTTGGLNGYGAYLDNSVLSPVMAWPDVAHTGLRMDVDAYVHEDLTPDAPGIFYQYRVRSTASADPADIQDAPWEGSNLFLYGGPAYRRDVEDLTARLVPDRQYVQVRLRVVEYGYYWGWTGDDGYPAPYFDNVRIVSYPSASPALTADAADLAGDAFPAAGVLDLDELGANSVRFDPVTNIESNYYADGIAYGDSIVCTARSMRTGGILTGPPRMHYRLRPNPVFDAYRTSGAPAAGSVAGQQVYVDGVPLADRFHFDLPDTGFLFPGDVLHYYLTAQDDVGGVVQTAILPADTTGFSGFSSVLSYDPDFTVRALPTVRDAGGGAYATPEALFWNDGGPGNDAEWVTAMTSMGWIAGWHYDFYRTLAPTRGVGNGLGGRSTLDLMEIYSTLLYSSGDLARFTLGDAYSYLADPGEDLTLLRDWLSLGDRNLLLTGNHLAADLYENIENGSDFLANWMGVDYMASNAPDYLDGQRLPRVVPEAGPMVLVTPVEWFPYSECGTFHPFDLVTAGTGTMRIAEFTSPLGQTGHYPYAAATMHPLTDLQSHVAYLPYDLGAIWSSHDPAKTAAESAQRSKILADVVTWFGLAPGLTWPAPVPAARTLAVDCYPNPFNPRTQIAFDLPVAGRVSIALYDVRGREVRRLLDETRPAGLNSVLWDGNDGSGRAAASGVYFYEVKAGDEMRLGKMMLLR